MKWNTFITSNGYGNVPVGIKWGMIVVFMVPIYSLSPRSTPGSMPRLSFG
ncbi:hypothetical protein [Peribacillus frigoritolerans]|nr:hypothetical protein [Peribacillus frigoritolerans]